jgi:glycerol-3-phosphate acyltransferase PlsX
VAAIKESLRAYPDVSFLLCGDKDTLSAEVGNVLEEDLRSRIEIRHSYSIVDGNDKPSSVVRSKADSSMAQTIRALAEGDADACVSGGNTGALMALGLSLLGLLPGISRPAICSEVPTQNGTSLVLDLGANIDCSADQLEQFALLGSLTVQSLCDISSPTIKLLNIGTEPIKGNTAIKQAAELLQAQPQLNYQGFIEGHGLFAGEADVVVCDGFNGNVALKASEGTANLIGHKFAQFLNRDWRSKLAVLLLGDSLSELKLSIQPKLYNGAYLLGLSGVIIKSHGGADQQAFAAALSSAIVAAQHQLPSKLAAMLENN